MIKYWLALAAIPAIATAYPATTATTGAPSARIDTVSAHGPGEISLLTYNVQDLPWPLAGDRSDAFAAIGDRLSNLRARGAHPQLVVLQEAFSPSAVEMLRKAGYAHIVTGPAAEAVRSPAPAPLDPGFLANRNRMIGEDQPAQLSSGLVIASDFPVKGSAAEAFPADVCAGIDCLANKGVMLARIAVPGLQKPVELVTTHLNSGRKSRTPYAHHLYAYRQQLRAVDGFLARHGQSGALRLFAGDVNVSHSAERLSSLTAHARNWRMAPVAAMGKPEDEGGCGAGAKACKGPLKLPANVQLIHTLDWQFASPGGALKPVSRAVLFGREPDGAMLSDHIGFSVRYRISG